MAAAGLSTTAIPEREAGARLTIDCAALVANWRALGARHPDARCGAAVKADAYGLGVDAVVPALAAAGCGTFFVAHLAEARRVRALAERSEIYVLNGLVPGSAGTYAAHDLRPVLGDPGEVGDWQAFCAMTGWQGGAALHVDTGITRLGLTLAEAEVVARAVRQPRLTLLLTHLACAEQPQHPLNAAQIERFAAIRALFPEVPGSIANSSGLFLPGLDALDVLRPGAALYGINPTPGAENPMHPVVALEARIIAVREAAAGDTVGYGARWICPRRSRIAILSLGYADGFVRAGSRRDGGSGAEVAIAGRRCPVVGVISMDLTAVDVTDLPEGAAARGGWAEVIGPTVGVDEVAARAGTIGYEILTGLGPRFHRRILPA